MEDPAAHHPSGSSPPPRWTRRGGTACLVLACAVGAWTTVDGAAHVRGGGAAPAQAQEVRDSALLQGADVGEEALPLDPAGRPIVDGLPGVFPPHQVPQAVRDDLGPLEEERDRVLDAARAARVSTDIPPLPGDVNAPAPVDSGAADPDRLLPASQPPLPIF
jgi:hypothetical protein